MRLAAEDFSPPGTDKLAPCRLWPARRLRLESVAETLLFNALREAIDEEMARDPHVCVLGSLITFNFPLF